MNAHAGSDVIRGVHAAKAQVSIARRDDLTPTGVLMRLQNLGLSEDFAHLIGVWKVNRNDDREKPDVWVLEAASRRDDNNTHMRTRQAVLTIRMRATIVKTVPVNDSLLEVLYQDALPMTLEEQEQQSRLIKKFETMVEDAIRERQSDIHLECRQEGSRVRVRINGELNTILELSSREAMSLASAVYNARADVKQQQFSPALMQSGSIRHTVMGQGVKIRWESVPAYPGDGAFDAVMRILPLGNRNDPATPIPALGYEEQQARDILDAAGMPSGAIILAGTTGSGKTTTIKNIVMFINESNSYRHKIYTVEDPPEYIIPQTTQVPVVRDQTTGSDSHTATSPFLGPVRSLMRMDPDVIVLGEVRDRFTAAALKQITQTGHQSLTTVHADSAFGVVPRLIDNGIEPAAFGAPNFINCLIFQRLVPLLCPKCSVRLLDAANTQAFTEDMERMREHLCIALDGAEHLTNVRLRGPGCTNHPGCREGIIGRTVCAEVIMVDNNMMECFARQDFTGVRRYWRTLSDRNALSDNMTGKSIVEHGLLKCYRGLVSPDRIKALLGPIDRPAREYREADAHAHAARAALAAEPVPVPTDWRRPCEF